MCEHSEDRKEQSRTVGVSGNQEEMALKNADAQVAPQQSGWNLMDVGAGAGALTLFFLKAPHMTPAHSRAEN